MEVYIFTSFCTKIQYHLIPTAGLMRTSLVSYINTRSWGFPH